MPIDRFSVEHRVGTSGFLRLRLRRVLRGLADPLVRPIDSRVTASFVVGCGHSGTTLLAAKLGRLPGCYVPGWETAIFLPDHGLAWSKAAFGTLIKTAETNGCRVILEKTPKHIHCTDRIRRLLPGARFLVLTRNPLDTCASLLKRFGSLDYAIERWLLDNSAAAAVLRHEDALHLRYEALTSQPEIEFSRAAEFIGLSWDPLALAAGVTVFAADAAESNMSRRAVQVSGPVASRTGSWRDVLSPTQAEQIRSKTRELAAALGYED